MTTPPPRPVSAPSHPARIEPSQISSVKPAVFMCGENLFQGLSKGKHWTGNAEDGGVDRKEPFVPHEHRQAGDDWAVRRRPARTGSARARWRPKSCASVETAIYSARRSALLIAVIRRPSSWALVAKR